jgi:hypothetical protein
VEVNASYSPEDGGRLFVFLRDVQQRNRSEALLRTRDEYLYIPLHHQLRPWAMKKGVTTMHRADDRPEARFTSVNPGGS